MNAKSTFLGSIAFVLAACASVGPIAYGPVDKDGFGYDQTQIEENRYRVVYRGSGGMTPELVEDYALRRAAELTVEQGYDWFRVVGREVVGDQRGGVSLGAGVGTGSYGRSSGVNVGVGGNLGTVGARKYFTARIEVLLDSGDVPEDSDVYDAQSILQSIVAEPIAG